MVELLAVILIMSLLGFILLSATNSLGGAQNFASEVSDIQQLFDNARAYAMANNLYVLVGMEQVDGTREISVTPQVAGVGRLAVGVVATTVSPNVGGNITIVPGNLNAINQLKTFPNLYLLNLSAVRGTASSQLYNRVVVAAAGQIGDPGMVSGTFTWPLTPAGATAQYTFDRVLEFNPDGTVVFLPAAGGGAPAPQWLELGLQQTHGNVVPPAPLSSQQVAAIQIDGITGKSEFYRQ